MCQKLHCPLVREERPGFSFLQLEHSTYDSFKTETPHASRFHKVNKDFQWVVFNKFAPKRPWVVTFLGSIMVKCSFHFSAFKHPQKKRSRKTEPTKSVHLESNPGLENVFLPITDTSWLASHGEANRNRRGIKEAPLRKFMMRKNWFEMLTLFRDLASRFNKMQCKAV